MPAALSEVDVVYTVTPIFGFAPLTVTIVVVSVDIPESELDPFAMAHAGYYDEVIQEFDPFQMSHFGYFLENLIVTYLWKFGDGQQFVGLEPGGHTYSSPGTYTLILCVLVNGDEIQFPTEIRVEGTRGSTEGIGQNVGQRRSLNYGNDENQGYGWSRNTGNGHLWPDTYGSIISLFNEELDHEQIIYDSLTGLPFIFDGRKLATSTKIREVFKNKVNPLVEGSGTEIIPRIRLPEYLAAKESYYQRMSDINVFIEPMYRANQGAVGYTAKGLRNAFALDLELYADEKLEKVAHADDVPIDRELFFDRQIVGRVLQIAFEMASSEFRLTKTEVYLINTDRSRYPSEPDMTERGHQTAALDVQTWYTRSERLLANHVNGNFFNSAVPFTAIIGPDGYGNSGFSLSDDTFLFSSTVTSAITLWSDLATNPLKNATIVPTIFDSFVRDGTTWYFWTSNSTGGGVLDNLLPGQYFDVKGYKNPVSLTTKQLQYQFDDVSENRANDICPLWS